MKNPSVSSHAILIGPPGVQLRWEMDTVFQTEKVSVSGAANVPFPGQTSQKQVIHEKKHPTFHYTGGWIGILITVYHNPYIQ